MLACDRTRVRATQSDEAAALPPELQLFRQRPAPRPALRPAAPQHHRPRHQHPALSMNPLPRHRVHRDQQRAPASNQPDRQSIANRAKTPDSMHARSRHPYLNPSCADATRASNRCSGHWSVGEHSRPSGRRRRFEHCRSFASGYSRRRREFSWYYVRPHPARSRSQQSRQERQQRRAVEQERSADVSLERLRTEGDKIELDGRGKHTVPLSLPHPYDAVQLTAKSPTAHCPPLRPLKLKAHS